MAGFIRRFSQFPELSVITEIEGVLIIDLIPPGIFVGRSTGTVCLVGEWPKGPVNTPVVVDGDSTIRDQFGGFSLSVLDHLTFAAGPPISWTNPYSNGNAFCWLKGKAFRRLVLCRVDTSSVLTVKIQVTGTPTPLTADLKIPAGTRVRDASSPNIEFAIAQDVVIAAGTDLAVAAFTAFDPTNLARRYTTRTVSGVPVYSTRNQPELAAGDIDSVEPTDLFRAGIGAGTALPSLVVIASTGLLDTAPANGGPVVPLNAAGLDTRYQNAITATLPGAEAVDNVELIAAARQSTAIRAALLANARDSSAVGTGRDSLVRPVIGTLPATAIGAVDPGVGAGRSDRVFYCYPHFEQRIAELAELDPTRIISSENILLGADSAMATILSQLAPELNPGQSTQVIQPGGILSFIRKLEDNLTGAAQPTKFTQANYTSFRAAGIAALRRDAQLGEWIFQSGVTSVDPTLFPSLRNIKRRRMADFIQDSLAAIAKRFNKQLATTDRVNSMVGEMADFLDVLKSETNPSAQRIAAFSIDSTSGNTTQLRGTGIFVVNVKVQLLDSLDFIVLQTTIGEGVDVSVIATDAA